MAGVSQERQAELEREPWSLKLRSRAAWSDAATYTVADLTMLRRELLIGYVVAGFLAVLVPVRAWNDVFLHGHGVLTTIENVVVGPLITIVAFVCSIGNVPLAAALWHGGISFGGVIAFVFADLITLPLLLIYRKYYGARIMLRLLVWFWAVMAVAGFLVEELFLGFRRDPARPQPDDDRGALPRGTTRRSSTSPSSALAGYLYWLYRNRTRFGGGTGCTRSIPCAACRSRSPGPRPPHTSTTGRTTTSAPTTAGAASRQTPPDEARLEQPLLG